jgi:hypothetical protein
MAQSQGLTCCAVSVLEKLCPEDPHRSAVASASSQSDWEERSCFLLSGQAPRRTPYVSHYHLSLLSLLEVSGNQNRLCATQYKNLFFDFTINFQSTWLYFDWQHNRFTLQILPEIINADTQLPNSYQSLVVRPKSYWKLLVRYTCCSNMNELMNCIS